MEGKGDENIFLSFKWIYFLLTSLQDGNQALLFPLAYFEFDRKAALFTKLLKVLAENEMKYLYWHTEQNDFLNLGLTKRFLEISINL